MKKISVLKLGNMNRENLKKREMNLLMGGTIVVVTKKTKQPIITVANVHVSVKQNTMTVLLTVQKMQFFLNPTERFFHKQKLNSYNKQWDYHYLFNKQ